MIPQTGAAGRLRLQDGLVTFVLALVAYLGVPVVAAGLFGYDTLAFYAAAFVLAPLAALTSLAWPLILRRCAAGELGIATPVHGWMLRAFFTVLVIVPASAAMALIIERLFGISFEEINNALYALDRLDTAGLVVAGIGIVLLAPVAEELLLRGVVFGALRNRFGPSLAIVLSAALFSVLHVAWAVMPIIFMLGLVFGWLRQRSGSVWPSVLLHGLNNLWSFGLFLLTQ
jgi:membrane protease YdiL (CAAX protease family)